MKERKRLVARLSDWDVRYQDRYGVGLFGTYELPEQCISFNQVFTTDMEFITKFLEAVGVESVKELNGKKCFVTVISGAGESASAIFKIEPLMPDEGKPFNIEEWRTKHK